MRFRFDAALYEWSARANWFFVRLPEEQGADIAEVPREPRGFGAVKVRARIGATTWSTSIFPSDGTYVLPVKSAVLRAEQVEDGDVIAVDLEVLDS
ncbi:DUF1905 domain-containing protein [Rathayibacter sp. YIM 133350]|uniref:DUF1905 domain-containing protein n=1 Tax=Rathayibacter sp. YIM 133350 TaxID=3131992 RepID=UPI00307CCA8D